jgi:membrane protein required for colicin V production
MGLAAIDFVFIVIILIFALHCALKGFVSEVMSLAAVILGILSAIFFFRAGAEFIRESFIPEVKVIPEILAFIVIFFIAFIAVKLLEKMLKTVIEGIHLGGLNHVLGFIFGVAEGTIVVCLVLFVISILPFVDSDRILGESLFAAWLLPFVMGIREEASDMVAQAVETAKGMFARV